MERALVILAAGVGSRYGGLKQLAPVGPSGEALLEYSVYDAVRHGFSRVVLVVRAETEAAFRTRFDSPMAEHVDLVYVHQRLHDLPAGVALPADRVKPWGTGQAVLAAESALHGPFGVINADDFYGASAYKRLGAFLDGCTDGEAAVVGFPVGLTLSDAGPVSRARCRIDDRGFLREIQEIKEVWRQGSTIAYRGTSGRRDLAEDDLVSMNMWGFSHGVLGELRRQYELFMERFADRPSSEFLLPDAIQRVMVGGLRVEVLRGTGPWCGLTFSQDEARTRALLARLVDQGRYPARLWS